MCFASRWRDCSRFRFRDARRSSDKRPAFHQIFWSLTPFLSISFFDRSCRLCSIYINPLTLFSGIRAFIFDAEESRANTTESQHAIQQPKKGRDTHTHILSRLHSLPCRIFRAYTGGHVFFLSIARIQIRGTDLLIPSLAILARFLACTYIDAQQDGDQRWI